MKEPPTKEIAIVLLSVLAIIFLATLFNYKEAYLEQKAAAEELTDNLRDCEEVECAYQTEDECIHGEYGYLKTYAWLEGWVRNCAKEGKIFTIAVDEQGSLVDARCAVEEDDR